VLVNNKTLQMLSLARNIFENDLTVNSLIEMIEKNQTLIQLEIDGRDLSRSDVKKLKTMAKTKRNFKLTIS
jgi:tRNA pseudouridine-54 N-methylase